MTLEQSNHNVHVIHLNNEFEIRKELANIKTDKKVHDLLIQKMIFLHIKLEEVDTRAANLLKQHIHAIGGEAVISKDAHSFTERTTDVILSASKETLRLLAKKIDNLPYGLNKIAQEISKSLYSNYGIMQVGNKIFDFRQKTYIMGILKFNRFIRQQNYSQDMILERVNNMIKSGVDIIDICEDEMPNTRICDKNEEEEKLNNLIPLIRSIKNENHEIVLSINTGRCFIAKESINAGADMVIEAVPLKFNEQMAHLVAQRKSPIVLLNSQSFFNKNPRSFNTISDIVREIQSNISYATSQGIDKDKIIIEPGIGFGRSHQENFLILKQLSTFKYLNVPILVGLPKNSFLGEALRGKMRDTQISTIAANTMAIINGANIIRVHDVEQAVAIVNIIDTIRNSDIET